ncbi:hypothetical protein Hypma_013637 [Hypsizygus marmoreus]|uniref:Uncharacterized protein n=1 Tax=Hypsizygus marmoreus TaxID=39966 RepID=A0A369JD96_HYPMA|nr:hypothetical protein Hypma_013637 [Hypsizygus marmoreus]
MVPSGFLEADVLSVQGGARITGARRWACRTATEVALCGDVGAWGLLGVVERGFPCQWQATTSSFYEGGDRVRNCLTRGGHSDRLDPAGRVTDTVGGSVTAGEHF